MGDDRRQFDRTGPDLGDEEDRLGFDETTNYVDALLGRRVPQFVARRAVAASIETDRERYAPGDPVEIDIEFRNRLPVPVTVRTPDQRLWSWTFDGHPEASTERRHLAGRPGRLDFRARERKRIHRRWNGLLKVVDGERRWVEPDRGEYELAAYLALGGPPRPEARTTIRIE
jgi:hypothetical protein